MSAAADSLAALGALTGAGLVPSLALAGLRPVGFLLAPVTGAVLSAAAAALTLVVGGPVLAWFAALAAVVAVAVVLAWARWPAARPRPFQGGWRLQAVGTVALVASSAVALIGLRAPSVGFDTRSIWMLHALWYADGHATAVATLRSRALPFAHATYPPLVGGSVAVSFLVAGTRSYRVGVIVLAVLNMAVVSSAALAVVEVGRRLSAVLARAAGPAGRPSLARWCRVPSAAAVVAAALLVLTAAGVAGPFATNGYADLLWAAAATGALSYALVLPPSPADLGAAAVLVAVAGLTKQEGYATAAVIVVAVAARLWWAVPARRRAVGSGAAAALVALFAWPITVRLLGAAPNVEVEGARQGTDASRARATFDAMAPHLHLLVLAVPVAVAGAVVLSRLRRRAGLGHDGWAWAVLAAGTGVVAVAYVVGPGNVEFWLATSVHRTTMFPALAAWWVTATWAVCGVAAVVARPALRRRPLVPAPAVHVGRPAGGGSTPAP